MYRIQEMNTSSCIGLSTMKPCRRVLISCKNSSLFGLPFPKFNHLISHNSSTLQSNLNYLPDSGNRVIGYTSVYILNRRAFCVSGSNSGQSRVFSGCPVNRSKDRFVSSIVNVASDIRNHSTSTEAQVNENNFEKIYVRGGLNVKPLVIEKIEEAHDVLEHDKKDKDNSFRIEVDGYSNVLYIDDVSNGLSGSRVLKSTPKREVSEVETEAWKLLRGAVVNYCGHPVGTVAAADPADKLPLNYDQVFIRDFVPSALAFLLNGEGEIVKNFLLHTLQLQVMQYICVYFPFVFYFLVEFIVKSYYPMLEVEDGLAVVGSYVSKLLHVATFFFVSTTMLFHDKGSSSAPVWLRAFELKICSLISPEFG